MRIVNSPDEQQEAVAQGWNLLPAPRPSGFPQDWVEIDPAKGTMYRRCLLRTPAERKPFEQVVDLVNWVEDDKCSLGGYGISLETLIEEHNTDAEINDRPGPARDHRTITARHAGKADLVTSYRSVQQTIRFRHS